MASDYKLGTEGRNAACNGLVDYIDTGTGAGRIEIRTGSPPTNVSDASSGDLLATLTFSATAFGAAASGAAAAASITPDTNTDTSGTAGYFRIYRGAGADTEAICQGTVGESGDSPDMVIDNKTIVGGGTLSISAMTITIPIQ